MKIKLIPIIFAFLMVFSCKKKDDFPDTFKSGIKFDVSEHILEGESVSCVDFDSDGIAWIGAGSNLISYKREVISTWDVGSYVRDLSVGPDGKVWIATKDRGLALFDEGKFTYFTMQNSGLPRDVIIAVEAAPDGTVWFSCSAHMLGGLMHFDGKKFELFTPENSILNQNLVLDLKVDKQGNVFLSAEGTVGQSKIFMIDNRNRWTSLNDNGFYWIGALDVNSKSEAIVADDHSLSSSRVGHDNAVYIYQNSKWNKLASDFELDFFNRLFVDKRDYIWVQGSKEGDYQSYFVYDGQDWHRSKKSQMPEDFVYSVKVDPYNNIWFCTNEGIYILNQS
jgi:ligand-binding sensor domain-containing protein